MRYVKSLTEPIIGIIHSGYNEDLFWWSYAVLPHQKDLTMPPISIKPYEHTLIAEIADRAQTELKAYFDLGLSRLSRMDVITDLTVCHATHPLRLEDLRDADTYSFVHDILGIRRHLNRDTGELRECFLPQYVA